MNSYYFVTVCVLLLFVTYTIYKIVFLKKLIANHLYKNAILIHDLRGTISTFNLIIDDLNEQNSKQKNIVASNKLASAVEILEEIKQDIHKSISKLVSE